MKKVYILLAIAMLLYLGYVVTESYAKYSSQGIATAGKQAGAWIIDINDTDVVSKNSTKSFQIRNLTYPTNNYVLENKMAPSSSGYFDIIINPTGCSVAVKFDVTIDLTALSINNAIRFQSACKVIDGQENISGMTRTGLNTYTGTISLADIKLEKTTTARFYLCWDEDGTGANDENDSAIGVARTINSNLNLPITVVLSQYSGETIVPYE